MTPESNENRDSQVTSRELFTFKLPIKVREQEVALSGKWLRLVTCDGRTLEGSFYEPIESRASNEVIVFIPGMPGDTVERFENEAVPELLKARKSIFVARHNGLKVDNQDIDKILHNSNRVNFGNVPGDASDLFLEPKTAIEFFSESGYKVTLLTHSIGSVAAAKSIIELHKQGSQSLLLGLSWVNAAGSLWDTTEDKIGNGINPGIDAYQGASQYFAGYYNMPEGNPSVFASQVIEVLKEVRSQLPISTPLGMSMVNVYAKGDKLVDPIVGEDFQSLLGKRGLLLKYEAGVGASGHEFSGATPEGLAKILLKTFRREPKGRRITIH